MRASEHILIAEDSPTQAQRLQFVLEEDGYDVTWASNGADALDILGQTNVDAVVTDVMMPVMDGYALCRAIKDDPDLSRTPVILLTTLSEPEDILLGLEARADSYLTKPFDEGLLRTRLRFLLEDPFGSEARVGDGGLEVSIGGRQHSVTAEPAKILGLLLSTYQNAVHQNRQLTEAQDAVRELNRDLELRVEKRTEDLTAANRQLEQQRAALVRSNEELERFAYVASHDLQEPLRMVTSYVQLLARRYEGRLDADADDYIGFAVEGAKRMQGLISDLLTYSRVNTWGTALSPTDCGLLMEQCAEDLDDTIREAGATVTWDALPVVTADQAQIKQVLHNLIDNAVKFRRGNPPTVHVSACRQGEGWELSVKDNGIGIAPEHVDRIFVIFQRLNAREQYGGTGSGLPVCKRIVERHGGWIRVASKPGRGSTFTFLLPHEPVTPDDLNPDPSAVTRRQE